MRADSAHQGSLDIMQVQSFLMDRWRLHFSLATASRLVRRFDRKKSNRLDFDSFLSYVSSSTVAMCYTIPHRLNKFLQDMQASFRYYDSNNDGLLTKAEVRQALQQSGFKFDDTVFLAIFQVCHCTMARVRQRTTTTGV